MSLRIDYCGPSGEGGRRPRAQGQARGQEASLRIQVGGLTSQNRAAEMGRSGLIRKHLGLSVLDRGAWRGVL